MCLSYQLRLLPYLRTHSVAAVAEMTLGAEIMIITVIIKRMLDKEVVDDDSFRCNELVPGIGYCCQLKFNQTIVSILKSN